MSDPKTVSQIGIGSNIAGGITGVIGSFLSGSSSKKMYDYRAALAQQNAIIDKQNAEYALQKGGQQAVQAGLAGAQQFGSIRSAQAASGLDVNSGSAARVQDSQRLINSMNLDQIRSNAAKTAYDYNVKAVNDTDEAQLDTIAGQDAQRAAYINAGSTLLGTASSVSSKWLQASQVGLT